MKWPLHVYASAILVDGRESRTRNINKNIPVQLPKNLQHLSIYPSVLYPNVIAQNCSVMITES